MLAAGLIRLVLDDEGTAHGRFTEDTISYMLARPHERPHPPSSSGWTAKPAPPTWTPAAWSRGQGASSPSSQRLPPS